MSLIFKMFKKHVLDAEYQTLDNPRWYDWLLVIAILLVLIFLYGYMTESYANQRAEAAYHHGRLAGRAEILTDLKEREAEIAVQWWIGSTDMAKVRQRICSNVSQNAFKTEVKK